MVNVDAMPNYYVNQNADIESSVVVMLNSDSCNKDEALSLMHRPVGIQNVGNHILNI